MELLDDQGDTARQAMIPHLGNNCSGSGTVQISRHNTAPRSISRQTKAFIPTGRCLLSADNHWENRKLTTFLEDDRSSDESRKLLPLHLTASRSLRPVSLRSLAVYRLRKLVSWRKLCRTRALESFPRHSDTLLTRL